MTSILCTLCINEVLQFSEGEQLIKVRNKNPFYCAVVHHQPLTDTQHIVGDFNIHIADDSDYFGFINIIDCFHLTSHVSHTKGDTGT